MTTRRFKARVEREPASQAWVTYLASLNHLSTFDETREGALESSRGATFGYLEAAEKEGLLGAEERG